MISDDHPVVRQGLRSFLEAQGFAVVGEADDGAEAVRLWPSHHPDVLLTDLVMPGIDGIEAIRRLRAGGAPAGDPRAHQLQRRRPGHPRHPGRRRRLPAQGRGPGGARGRHPRRPPGRADAGPRGGGRRHGPGGRGDRRPATGFDPRATTPISTGSRAREREVLAGLGRGLTNRQLADELYVAEKTVKTHVSNLLAKLGLPDRTQAALFAVRTGLADPRR